MHDKAFDKGLIAINIDYRIVLSKTIKSLRSELSIQRGFMVYDDVIMKIPNKFLPDKKFLEYHVNNVFIN